MKNRNKFNYPRILDNIFNKLKNNGISSIIVGGYVRDFFLNIPSKDIDIELYGVESFENLENILAEFGDVNSVGKSFGVCKLSLTNLEIDFTLPRSDSKISKGHKGFEVKIEKNLDFTTAASRRDFTINALGFDVNTQKILDPFNGLEDIENKILQAVNLQTFSEDPLRVLRAAQFHSRLNFKVEKKLFTLCKTMCDENILDELPSQRIYTEIQKIILKSLKPSLGFLFLKGVNALKYLSPLQRLDEIDFKNILNALDKTNKTKDNKTNITIMLAILCYKFNEEDTKKFLLNLSNEKKLLKNILALRKNSFKTSYTDSQLYALAIDVNIEIFLLYSFALNNFNQEIFNSIKIKAQKLNILHVKAKPFLEGKDILTYGIEPSPKFSIILEEAYKAQISLEIQSHEEALKWLENYLRT